MLHPISKKHFCENTVGAPDKSLDKAQFGVYVHAYVNGSFLEIDELRRASRNASSEAPAHEAETGG